jgi:TolA-binding protein
MKREGIIIGAVLIVLGIGIFAYYTTFVKHEREAVELLTEGKLVYERGSREAINDSINIFSKVVARYPGTKAETESYFYIAQCYEKMNLNRLAYLKYVYILKNNRDLDETMVREIKARIAGLKVMKRRSEEGIHQLLTLLNYSDNREFRSRVYTELGHTYLQMREYEKSKRMFDIALTENGDNEEAILGKARAYKRLGQNDLAYGTYEYFLKYYGNFSNYADDVRHAYVRQVYRTGHESYRSGNYSAGISYFKRILNNFPDSDYTENCLYWTGQCYFALHKYGTAISYYDRVLGQFDGRKGEDARIKKGYSYFLLRKFDLAAREFQIYINNYPHGRNIDTARKWKSMSTQEMLYRIQNKAVPEIGGDDEGTRETKEKKSEGVDTTQPTDGTTDKAMTGRQSRARDYQEYENVGEL